MGTRTHTVARLVVFGGALVAVAALGVAFGFVVSHRTSVAVSRQLADVEFLRLRARFVDQQPLLDMGRREASENAITPAAWRRSAHSTQSSSILAAASGSFELTSRTGLLADSQAAPTSSGGLAN